MRKIRVDLKMYDEIMNTHMFEMLDSMVLYYHSGLENLPCDERTFNDYTELSYQWD